MRRYKALLMQLCVCTCLGKDRPLGYKELSVQPVKYKLRGNLWYIEANVRPAGKTESCGYIPLNCFAS